MEIKALDWPGNSPDLNIIENLWAQMKKKIRLKRAKTKEDLKKIIVETWEQDMDKDYLKNLYKSMPKRIAAVIKARGGSTKY